MIELFSILYALSPLVLGFLLVRCHLKGQRSSRDADLVRRKVTALEFELEEANRSKEAAQAVAKRLQPYEKVANADEEAAKILERVRELASARIAETKAETDAMRKAATDRTAKAQTTADALVRQAQADADATLRRARADAEGVLQSARAQASEAMELAGRERAIRATVAALENRLKGYDDSYIQPAALLLEGLAESYGSSDAANDLKAARTHTRHLLKEGRAAACDYAEPNRRETAVRFVAEAFNGAADSVLARVKVDNVGKLAQEIQDAFAIINHHGSAFRNARVTDEYLAARQAELQAAGRFQALLKREQEEQRAIRERIREEARAQREFEAAQRSAAKEEERVRKALVEAQRRFESAAAEDRARMEERLQALQSALAEAEAKSARALSMAQQTRAGHCYVISNEGSFGGDVLKIGMTRRIDPLDRVRELGDASVPFEFDVHAMVYSEDAPGLEKQLHRAFNETRVNMVNPRKEFFRVGLAAVREKLSTLGVEAEFTLAAAAREFRETQALQQASTEQRQAALAAVLAAEEHIEEDAEDAAEGVAVRQFEGAE